MRSSTLLALVASISATQAVYQGFNYGATKSDGTFNSQTDFQNKFAAAKALVGTSGFTSARLYTSIQGGSSTNEPTSAIPAAIAENVSLLLGIWASDGQGGIDAELAAIQSAINKYGDSFRKLIAGVSVGSEDLYRVSAIAKQNGVTDAGADAETIAGYISYVKQKLTAPAMGITAKVGHVDTWTAWNDSSNAAVIEAADWIGTDAYPYFQSTMSNDITSGKALFNEALQAVKDRANGKDVWITETGWPVTGKTENLAIPSTDNAKTYWDEVGCPLFGSVNTYWFTLQDYDGASNTASPNPSFGILGNDGKELFDLSCSDISTSSSSSSASATSSSSGSSTALSSVVTGGGVSPTNGAEGNAPSLASSGSVIATATGSSNGSSSTSGASGSGSGSGSSVGGSSNATGIATSSPKPSASTTGASPSTITANAASILTGSFIGAIGAAFVAIVAL